MVKKGWASKTMAAAFGLSVFGLLTACSYQIASGPGELRALPQREDGIKNVKIRRDRGHSGPFDVGSSMYITVNGKDISTLRTGESVEFGLAEGLHTIGIRCSKSDGVFTKWKHQEIPVQVDVEPIEISAAYIREGTFETCTLRI